MSDKNLEQPHYEQTEVLKFESRYDRGRVLPLAMAQ